MPRHLRKNVPTFTEKPPVIPWKRPGRFPIFCRNGRKRVRKGLAGGEKRPKFPQIRLSRGPDWSDKRTACSALSGQTDGTSGTSPKQKKAESPERKQRDFSRTRLLAFFRIPLSREHGIPHSRQTRITFCQDVTPVRRRLCRADVHSPRDSMERIHSIPTPSPQVSPKSR